jgi:hypothetical protein
MKSFLNQAASALSVFENNVSARLAEKGAVSLLSKDEQYTVSSYFWQRYSADLTAVRIMQYRAAAAK